jgi:hypothetical protein
LAVEVEGVEVAEVGGGIGGEARGCQLIGRALPSCAFPHPRAFIFKHDFPEGGELTWPVKHLALSGWK